MRGLIAFGVLVAALAAPERARLLVTQTPHSIDQGLLLKKLTTPGSPTGWRGT